MSKKGVCHPVFGYVSANLKELSDVQKNRYNAVYCGVCRRIREQAGQTARLCLSYDMTFLAMLHMSLYEPEEESGPNACALHPIHKRPWVDNEAVRYAADMNVALAYYNCLDDWQDDRSLTAKAMADKLSAYYPAIAETYPRQCAAIEGCIQTLSRLEAENCASPDEPAGCFGQLMGEILARQDDLWASALREMGMALGRFIYLADAAQDYEKDKKKNKYNPYIAAGIEDSAIWEEYLILAMGRCTAAFERLPLVQDKAILDNILYSGVWTHLRKKKEKEAQT